MNETVANMVCPNCAASTPVPAGTEPGVCAHCGRSLAADRALVPDERARLATREPVASEPDGPEKALVADLREAFGFQAGALCPVAQPALVGGPDASHALGIVLRAASLPIGGRLGDFEILGEIGRGGMGIVYRARQISLGREVALKVLPDCARHGRIATQRFLAEAQAAARLHHSNIVPVYAQGVHEGHYYYAMELVEGVGLDVVIHSRPDLLSSTRLRAGSSDVRLKTAPVLAPPGSTRLPRTRVRDRAEPAAPAPPADWSDTKRLPRWTRADYAHVARLFADVADALACAHQHSIIHRDVKPHNLLLGAANRLHLTDFGLARLTDEPHLTVSGEIMGTPSYMSPEQVRGGTGQIDHRTDIYSLGVTLYESLTRRKPFDGETRQQIITAICTAEPVSPRRLNPRIPLDLETICLRTLEKDPQRRHATAALLAEDLRRFADGRPILSRRVTRVERAVKWVRRHKALTGAIAGAIAVVVLASALTWSAWDARRREAESVRDARQREAVGLVDRAYERLAYYDYRVPELATADIERAVALGARSVKLDLARALACAGANDPAQALRHLAAAAQQDPNDPCVWYLRAWVQRQTEQQAAARATLDDADQRGGPTTPEAWFFRGLAVHFDAPLAAIDCYRRANDLRAREHQFYPQAVLHLARARNQQLYVTRTLEPLSEIVASLTQLIEQKQYAAFPYYLLSITHRLAAEIYAGSEGTRGDAPVTDHYDAALRWAREGQKVNPADDRPIAAEAECLESAGRYAEAIEARTRAIAAADADIKRWEGHHYRWRLHYWLGEFDAALQDLAACAGYDPHNSFYEHVYPALVQAEAGDMPAALAHAHALADDAPTDAQAVLWSATCLRLLGEPEEAQALLTERAAQVDFTLGLVPPQSEQWVRALYENALCGGRPETLEPLAAAVSVPWKLSGEAYFHAAALSLSAGDRATALDQLREAYRSFDNEHRYTYHGKLFYVKMRQNPSWPPWVGVSWEGKQGTLRDREAPSLSVASDVEQEGSKSNGFP